MSIAPTPSVVTLPAGIGGEDPADLLDALDRRFPRVGLEVWRRRIAERKVRWADGEAVRPGEPCRPGERLHYFREVEAEPTVPFREEVLYVDGHLLVADKPPFLPVHPAGRWVNECLLHRLRRATGIAGLAHLHRLDRATAGLVLFSTDPATRPAYHQLFDRGEVERTYRAAARVEGAPEEREWRRESRLVPGSPWFRIREAPGPPNARTRVVLESLRVGRGLFRLHPETGKKHQLRLHMAALGFPLDGDRLYPDLAPEAADDFDHPLDLLAWRLAFTDPLSGERREFTSRRSLQSLGEGNRTWRES
jgi:tRNA pseudouridine32 synthase / 23S rRNA pseudouridine746 synthase